MADGMTKQPIPRAEARTAGEVGRALARGAAVAAPPEIAAECGAEAGDLDELEDVLESHLRPYGEEPGP